eukprot:m.228344 g.228344  ORF g.228344 m.228344 type:complete len:63 (+) comp11730_c0_seq1:105-293(+)
MKLMRGKDKGDNIEAPFSCPASAAYRGNYEPVSHSEPQAYAGPQCTGSSCSLPPRAAIERRA